MNYEFHGTRELIERIHELERVLNGLLDLTNDSQERQEARIQAYEALGMTRGDAQGVVEAEELTHNLA